jgi:septal ring factor EnvC (AmiA/AmiB activator)
MLACESVELGSAIMDRVGTFPKHFIPFHLWRCIFDAGGRRRVWPNIRNRIGCLLCFFAIIVDPGSVAAQSAGREAELESIRDQIMALRGRLNRVRQEAGGLRGDLRETEVALELQNKRLEEARAARALAEESLATVETEIGDLELDLEELRELLRERMVDLHRLGQQGYVRLFLSIRSREDLLPGIRQMRFLVKRDGGLLEQYQATHTELSAKQSQLVEHREEVREWLEVESTRLDQLERLETRLSSLLTRLESEDRRLTQQTTRLADKEKKLANLIDFLYGRTDGPLSGTPVQNFRGVLDWPASGRVVKRFGPRLDLQYGTQIPHNGIELRTNPATDVQVVYPGKVLYAAPFQGFGLTAIVHHPGRVFTLYAGMKELRTRQDAVLNLGQVIGISADALYFEIRVENRPVDPLQWLR